MNVHPTKLELISAERLRVDWSDGKHREYRVAELRKKCPCATCREKKQQPSLPGSLTILSPAETEPIRIVGMRPVGNYAYNIQFSDGHDTGIFTLELLHTLGEEVRLGG